MKVIYIKKNNVNFYNVTHSLNILNLLYTDILLKLFLKVMYDILQSFI